MPKKPEPCILAIFGATGDLAHRKIFPALFEMSEAGELPEETIILGIGRNKGKNDTAFRQDMHLSIQKSIGKEFDEIAAWCEARVFYHGIGKGTREDYSKLKTKIASLEKKHKLSGNRIFHLAIPPEGFGPTVKSLGNSGLHASEGWTRLVIEKPFGRDYKTALALNNLITQFFTEDQIYRIDHYLGKETVQNILAFRFGNSLFESVWNREKIEKVEIVVAEELGIESRADYYEKSGALRDMVQNHLTQLLTLTAMEIPLAFNAEDLRFEKVKVLRSIAPIHAEDVVYGQYTEGELGGNGVRGYHQEEGVRSDSKTPTFVALKMRVENWRWHGVPFYLTTGKRLKEQKSEITITFRCPPVALFKSSEEGGTHPNVLVIAIQPNEGFRISFQVKKPGSEIAVQSEWMHFSYADAFGPIPDAYYTLLRDVMLGDQSLFVSADETLASWKLYTPVLNAHRAIHPYPAGSWGPKEAEKL
ncbi:MAG TPA: glucose-6-phosphate dehydrogenase [Candidatus Kapabacteria bacterium]|nr:glucose-6-phosphate dehydrogenase [Candidatus Kapabacteria bacterium]